ncbi:HD-domain/PDEase-like protein [Schizophyllum commune Tattone D]|nr:HD-domain/PDEase-like protein [Schizophyllum commune Tattone D]
MCPLGTGASDGSSSRQLRRRSADVGGLHLACTSSNGQGAGWVGDDGELQTLFAESLGDMYMETLKTVNEHHAEYIPTDLESGTRASLIDSLSRWHFEPHLLPEEHLLACTSLLFEALFRVSGMEEATGISMAQITPFIFHLRQIYRLENSYHNFMHALDVLQATYSFLESARMVPPVTILYETDRLWTPPANPGVIGCLGLRELFILYVAAIGHDVGHPGFTNVFMKNAQTPLSVVFDGKSALEHMHCQLLLRVMRQHGLGVLLDHPTDGTRIRRLLWETVMATDMSVHAEFMKNFAALVANPKACPRRQTLVCQAIMKCADISNPSRPYTVSQHWASALMMEWTSQAHLEQYLELPTTVQTAGSPLAEANSQIFFISNFAMPLIQLMVEAIPEMEPYRAQCAANLHTWQTRKEQLGNAPTAASPPAAPMPSPRMPDGYLTAFPLTLPPSHRTLEDMLVWTPVTAESSDSSDPGSPCSSLFTLTTEASTTASSADREGNAEIRAAGRAGMRKQRSIYSLNRNSWGAPERKAPAAFVAPPPATAPAALLASSPSAKHPRLAGSHQ